MMIEKFAEMIKECSSNLLDIGANLLKSEISFIIVSVQTLNLRASSGHDIIL